MRIGVLVSGRGSNLGAILDACAAGRLAGIEVALVVSNRRGVRALEVAAAHGVPSLVLRRRDFEDAAARDAAMGRALREASVQLAVLAGYDQLLQPAYFAAFGGPTINIHPSLLPAHGGRGMMGDAVHAAVLAAGDRVTGVTIHRVTPALDAGPAIARAEVPVEPGDSVQTLAARVLRREHELLVATLADLPADLAAGGLSGMPSATMTAASRLAARDGAPQERPEPHA